MKCAILVSNLRSGGAERVAVNLANGIRSKGSNVDVVLVEAVGNLIGDVEPGVRVIDLHSKRARNAIRSFRRYVRSQQPDVVLPITYEMNMVAGLALTGLERKPRLLLTVHNPLRRFRGTHPLWRLAATTLSRRLYPRAEWVIAVSHGVAADLVAHKWVSPDRVRTIHNPIVSSDLLERSHEPLPPDLFDKQSVPTIVNVGRLVPQKNHSLLLEAFKRVLLRRPVQLWIVGEGPCRAALEKQIADLGLVRSVKLLGHLENPFAVVRAANVFALSSDHEGFGNVLVEAMAVGTPVVSTDCPHGPRDILEGGKWGRLVPPGDPEALADALLEVLSNGGIDGRDRARDFTIEQSVDSYMALMQEALSR